EGLLDHLRNGRARQIEAPLMRIFGEDRAIAGVHARRDRRLVGLELRRVGQIALVNLDEPIGRDGADHEKNRAGREEKADEPEKQSHRERPRRVRALAARCADGVGKARGSLVSKGLLEFCGELGAKPKAATSTTPATAARALENRRRSPWRRPRPRARAKRGKSDSRDPPRSTDSRAPAAPRARHAPSARRSSPSGSDFC